MDFGAIGALIVAVSRLEFALDDFLFRFAEKYGRVARSLTRSYPYKMTERVDLLIAVLVQVRELRTEPIFDDGFLELNWLGYAFDELFEERNAVAHGASFIRECRNGRTVFYFYRYARMAKNRYQRVQYRISNYGLAHLTDRAHDLRRYLQRLLVLITSCEGWAHHYRAECEIRDNWRLLVRLGVAKLNPESCQLYIPSTRPADHALD